MQLRYRMLVFKMSRMAAQNKLPVVQEIGFATELAELVGKENVGERVIAELFEHAHPQIRRIALNAIRRAGRFDQPGLQPALLLRLADPEPWLRHDAAWLIQEAGLDDPHLRIALWRVAGNVRLPQDAARAKANPGDALLHGQVRARQVLDILMKKDNARALAALRATIATLNALSDQPYGSGTVGQLNQIRREQKRRGAGRGLASSTRLTFRRVERPDGEPAPPAGSGPKQQP